MSDQLSNFLALRLNGAALLFNVSIVQDRSKYCREEIKFTCAILSISSISRLTLTYM